MGRENNYRLQKKIQQNPFWKGSNSTAFRVEILLFGVFGDMRKGTDVESELT